MNREILGNRYEVQQQLSKKAGRKTLLTRDINTDELVIVKLVSFGNDFEWDDLKLFEREAAILQSLSHPFIPRYLDYFEVNSPTYKGFALVQTYIPAPTLEQYLHSGRTFTEAEVKAIAQAVLEILIYLQSLNPPVIHRDIKPSNILLAEKSDNSVGQVYLVDFGSVQTILAAEGGTRTVVGTYGYMPPEQFGGRTTPASDLFSLGATLIYLVTGIHPADLPQIDFRIQFQPSTPLSPSFTHWLQLMTEPSLERRLSSATEALTALQQLHLAHSPAITVKKPYGSKIQLTKNNNFLEILIPPVGFQPSIIFLALFATAWNSFILFWTIGVLFAPFPVNIPFALFSLPFWGAGLSMIYKILLGLFGTISLRIDHQQIAITQKIGQFSTRRSRLAPRQSITKIIYIPAYLSKNYDGERTQIPGKLTIWVGVEKFELDVNTGLLKSETELEWLAEELSTWLGIPINRE
jgi:serine/threonine protein kinase